MRKLRIHRKAVSSMISGVIVLALLLTALIAVVFVSQQYDQYQTQANRMSQFSNERLSEYLAFNSPGITLLTSATVPGWGSGCGIGGTYNCYGMTMSNLGDVGVQIVRIYINSTGSGCSSPNPQPCILNPTLGIASYAFNQANQFVNPGETNHTVVFALPIAVTLPNPNPAFPENSIVIATAMGNVFSFQWPFQVSLLGQSQSAYSQGNMRIAYTGSGTGSFDSANEPGHGGSGIATNGYCHNELSALYPAPAGYAEELTGITGYGDGGVLWFVNPWLTAGQTNGKSIVSSTGGLASGTTLYMYVIVVNTGTTSYSPSAGTLDLTWYGSNHIDGKLIGVYYDKNFYLPSNPANIPPGAFYYAIFVITHFTIGSDPWTVQPSSPSVMWWGGASITNAYSAAKGGSNAEDQSYWAGTVLVSGLWMRYEPPTGGPCA